MLLSLLVVPPDRRLSKQGSQLQVAQDLEDIVAANLEEEASPQSDMECADATADTGVNS